MAKVENRFKGELLASLTSIVDALTHSGAKNPPGDGGTKVGIIPSSPLELQTLQILIGDRSTALLADPHVSIHNEANQSLSMGSFKKLRDFFTEQVNEDMSPVIDWINTMGAQSVSGSVQVAIMEFETRSPLSPLSRLEIAINKTVQNLPGSDGQNVAPKIENYANRVLSSPNLPQLFRTSIGDGHITQQVALATGTGQLPTTNFTFGIPSWLKPKTGK